MSKFIEQEDSKKVTTLSDYEIQDPTESLLRPFVLKYRSTVVQVVYWLAFVLLTLFYLLNLKQSICEKDQRAIAY
jgi:hypothetical protein